MPEPYVVDVNHRRVFVGNRIRNRNAIGGNENGVGILTLEGKIRKNWMWRGDSGARCGVDPKLSMDERFGIEKLYA